STALGSGVIGSLLVVHGENCSVFAASVLVRTRSRRYAGDRYLPDSQQDERSAIPSSLPSLREPRSRSAQRTRGRRTSRRLPRAMAVGWFAAATYGAGTLTAAAKMLFATDVSAHASRPAGAGRACATRSSG